VDLGIPVGGVQAFLPDREGNLWIAAERGLVRYRDGRAELLDARWGLAHDFVMSLLEDREGNLWVGTRAGGVTRISDAPFTAFTKREGLSDDMAGVIQEDGEGDIWAATDTGGVNRLRGRSVRVYTTRDGLLSDMVSAVWPARQGGVWIGTDRGVNHILGERVSTLLEMDRAVTALLEDRGGDLWIGTNAGLHRWSHERLTTYTTREGLSSDHVADLREGRDGALWIATLDGGVTRLHGGQFTRYTVADGLPAHGTTAIYEDQDGVVWIGTLGGGLARLKDGRIAGFRQEHALPDKVGSILEDDRGYLWMGSNTGVVRVAKADLHAAADGRGGRIAFTTYGRAEGMPTRECKVGGWRSRDGRLWFATIKGVTVIDPNRLPPQAPPPPAIIEEMRVNGKPVALADGRELDPGSNALELVYTALRLSDPETLRFRYRLEGLDTEWQEVGPRRTAYYTNLPPGRYRFRVSAGNPEGAWNEADAELSFRIRPRFYQTTWFALFLATAVLGAAFALHRFQVALLQARNAVLEERNRIAREVHDGVAQGIGGIAIQLEAARGAADADRAAQHVERARGLADQTLTELRRSLSALRPALLDGLSLPEAMDRLLEPFAAGAGVEARLEVVGQEIELAAEPATHVLRITQEALYNAVRHGHPRRIEIQLSYEPHHLRLRVADDGHGFARDSPGPGGEQGHGLRTMRERAERLGGRLSVTSAPDRGTEVVLLLPTRGRALATLWSALVRLGAGRPAA
jgi:signal transduction histidine kinase